MNIASKTLRTYSSIFLLVGVLFSMVWILSAWQDLNFSEKDNLIHTSEEDEPDAVSAIVGRVIDGDTIDLSDGRRVRYIGIDTPEVAHRAGEKDECFGERATARNRELVAGKEIRLVKDESETDK